MNRLHLVNCGVRFLCPWIGFVVESSQGRHAFKMSSLENGVMKRLFMFFVAVAIMTHLTGCNCGRFFKSRGARCGVPSFRMPSFTRGPAVTSPCVNGGCATGTVAPYDATPYSTAPPTEYSNDGWTPPMSSTMSVSPAPTVENGQQIYAARPVVTGEVISGPEIGVMPTP